MYSTPTDNFNFHKGYNLRKDSAVLRNKERSSTTLIPPLTIWTINFKPSAIRL